MIPPENPSSTPSTLILHDGDDMESSTSETIDASDRSKRHSRIVSDDRGRDDLRRSLPLAAIAVHAPSALRPICITGTFDDVERKYYVDASRLLGTGHNGSVRECVDRTSGRRLAIKSIRKSDPRVKPAGIAREIVLLREMDHDNVVRLVDIVEDYNCVHIITNLCEGGELFDKIVERSEREDDGHPCFPEGEAANIIRQVLASVSYMHSRNVVHRDVKPENVLFETSEAGSKIKLIDFGLSRKHRPDESPMSTLVGTPYYVAPEVLRQRYDRSCDLWSVGVMAYILLCGYPPFNGEDNNETHRSVLRGRYCFPVEEWEHISEEAMDFIRSLLRTNPLERMTAEEALRHPWVARREADAASDVAMADADAAVGARPSPFAEERRDRPSPVVVRRRSPPSPPRKMLAASTLGRQVCPRSPERRLRMSAFIH